MYGVRLHGGCLASTVVAKETIDLILMEVERQSIDGRFLLPKDFGQVLDGHSDY